jgi:tetratricopeptide (TPR) repeat protein
VLVAALAGWIAVLTVATWRHAAVWSDGVALWRAALAADPSSFHGHTGLGDELVGRDDAAAITAYEAALRIRPHAGTQLALAQLYVKAKRSDEAMDGFRRAIALGSDDWRAPYGLGSMLMQAGRAAEAVAMLERARGMNPDGADVQNNLAIAYLRAGDVPSARRTFEGALRADPGDAKAAIGLGSVIERHDGPDAARAYYERVLRTVRPGEDRAQLEARLRAVGGSPSADPPP